MKLVYGYILTGFLTIVSFLLPIKGFLLAVGLMVLLDTIVGIYTTIKLNGIINANISSIDNITKNNISKLNIT